MKYQNQHFLDFDAAPARRIDPPTSIAAGQAMTAAAVDEHERLILAALAAGPAGKTELAARIGPERCHAEYLVKLARESVKTP